MIEISEDIPFLWRLSSDNGEGFSLVSMVVPFNTGKESHEHTITTDVLSFSSDLLRSEEEEILEWNEDDISLFLKLLSDRSSFQIEGNHQTFRIDLTDPETIEIVHIVAAAGFGMAQPAEELLVETPCNAIQTEFRHEIGSQISLRTRDGYKRAVVVDEDEEDVICVMLEKINLDEGFEIENILPHDLLMVKPHFLLPHQFSSQMPSATDVLH